MAKRNNENMVCPECKGRKTMLYKDEDGELIAACDFCNGTGVFSDMDNEQKFYGKWDFNG